MGALPCEKYINKKTNHRAYGSYPLVELTRLIAENGDEKALDEFHQHRTVFVCRDKEPKRLVEYLEALRGDARAHWGRDIADGAYDLIIDKFGNLPELDYGECPSPEDSVQEVKRKGPDCRYYFRAFLKRMEEMTNSGTASGEIDEEYLAARTLQGLVKRHFYLSCLECARKADPLISRYFWRVKGGTICVWLPRSMPGRQRRSWLEENIEDPDPSRPGECERVQAEINKRVMRGKIVSFGRSDGLRDQTSVLPPWSALNRVSPTVLAEVIASEKAENVDRQRPAIRALGRTKLKEMILDIFGGLGDGDYRDHEIAARFGLSKATFSRFAGSQWAEEGGGAIPDLWRNVAEILAGYPEFAEVAHEAGVWPEVKRVAGLWKAGKKEE